MHYVLYYTCVENMLELRKPVREEHLALVKAAHAAGDLVLAGAYPEPPDGSVLIFQGEDTEKVKDFVTHDPYVTTGLVTEWHIRPLMVAVGG